MGRETTETPVKIGDVQEPVVALVDHGLEINPMSMDFYKKGKWPINTKHWWKYEQQRPPRRSYMEPAQTYE